MRFLRLKLIAIALLLVGITAQAQGPKYGIGRAPTSEEVRAWDIAINPFTGEELPAGAGTADQGAELFLSKGCAGCHGTVGTDGLAPRLVKREIATPDDPWQWGRILPIRAPYAPVIWDYINRGMPLGAEGTLTPDEVYALTAYLLFLNDVIDDDLMVLNQENLPEIEMPNKDNWAPLPDWWEPGMPRLLDYPY